MTSAGAKFDAWVALAEELGLELEVEDRSDAVIQSVCIAVSRKQVEPTNALEDFQNRQRVYLQAVRTRFNRSGRWSNSVKTYTVGISPDLVNWPVRSAEYWLRKLAND